MVDLRQRVESAAMCIDTTTTNVRRPVFPSIKFRLREERKRVIGITKAKYHSIEDHETGMRRFCLIRNTLQCLQREAREEKLARHNARANNVSPSYLSASRPRSTSPPFDMEVADVLSHYGQPVPSPIAALSDDEDEMPPCKRPRLFLEDDKENQMKNSCEDRLVDVIREKGEPRAMDDTQEILREVYESYTGENVSQSQPSSPYVQNQSDTSNSMLYCSTTNLYSNNLSSIESNSPTDLSCSRGLNTSSSNFNNSEYSRLSVCTDWLRPHKQYPCSQSAFLGSDLQSVVYQSLITSL